MEINGQPDAMAALTQGNEPLGNLRIGGLVGPEPDGCCGKEKIFPLLGIEPQSNW
jgi:hypothetical protein